MNRLLVAWKDPKNSLWRPVATLDKTEEGYTFRYTEQASKLNGFKPFGIMSKLNKEYTSSELFPLFSNRLLSSDRPEYKNLINWLGLEGKDDPFSVLAATHGERATDSLKLFSCPTLSSDKYEAEFFIHGLGYLDEHAKSKVETLKVGDPLFLMDDYQNAFSRAALAIRTIDPKVMIGYCPDFLAPDIRYLSSHDNQSKLIVKKVNQTAPTNFKLLCSFSAKTTPSFKPFGQSLTD